MLGHGFGWKSSPSIFGGERSTSLAGMKIAAARGYMEFDPNIDQSDDIATLLGMGKAKLLSSSGEG